MRPIDEEYAILKDTYRDKEGVSKNTMHRELEGKLCRSCINVCTYRNFDEENGFRVCVCILAADVLDFV